MQHGIQQHVGEQRDVVSLFSPVISFYLQLFSSVGSWKLSGPTFVHFWNQCLLTTSSWISGRLISYSSDFDFKPTWHSASRCMLVNVRRQLHWHTELTLSLQRTGSQASLLMSTLWTPSHTAWYLSRTVCIPARLRYGWFVVYSWCHEPVTLSGLRVFFRVRSNDNSLLQVSIQDMRYCHSFAFGLTALCAGLADYCNFYPYNTVCRINIGMAGFLNCLVTPGCAEPILVHVCINSSPCTAGLQISVVHFINQYTALYHGSGALARNQQPWSLCSVLVLCQGLEASPLDLSSQPWY